MVRVHSVSPMGTRKITSGLRLPPKRPRETIVNFFGQAQRMIGIYSGPWNATHGKEIVAHSAFKLMCCVYCVIEIPFSAGRALILSTEKFLLIAQHKIPAAKAVGVFVLLLLRGNGSLVVVGYKRSWLGLVVTTAAPTRFARFFISKRSLTPWRRAGWRRRRRSRRAPPGWPASALGQAGRSVGRVRPRAAGWPPVRPPLGHTA